MKKITKKLITISVFLCSVFNLVSCSATELEERCFPMVVGVGYEEDSKNVSYVESFPRIGGSGETEPLINEIQVAKVSTKSFESSKEMYENRLNKFVDYNHLKVLVFEEDLLEQKSVYGQVLKSLAEGEEFPRNTYVCAVENMDDLIGIEKNLPQDLGTYLEEYLNNHEADGTKMVTLGDLIDEMENNELTVNIPILDVEKNFVEWKRNFIMNE